MNILIVALLIILIGLVALMLVNMSRRHDDNGQIERMREYIKGLDESNRRNIESLRQNHSDELRSLAKHHEQQIQTLENQWRERMAETERRSQLTFEQLSRTALDNSVNKLKADNGELMNNLLSPFGERLSRLTQLIQNAQVESAGQNRSLSDQITLLARLNQTMSDDAKALTEALKGNSKVQGDWGETILRTILEKAGLEEGINFRFQPGSDSNGIAYRGEDNNLLRPDFIIDLPDNRHLIVDSKVSLTDYVAYCESTTDADREKYGKRHVDSVKKHINELRAKRYERVVPGAMEHVLMFMPNDGAYITAMQLDADLWRYAFNHKVVIVSGPHLLSAVQIISQLWRQDRQDRNAMEIARVAGLLYDSFVSFNEKFSGIGTDIERAGKSFATVAAMLREDNSKSMLRRARKLKELGAKTTRNLPNE